MDWMTSVQETVDTIYTFDAINRLLTEHLIHLRQQWKPADHDPHALHWRRRRNPGRRPDQHLRPT